MNRCCRHLKVTLGTSWSTINSDGCLLLELDIKAAGVDCITLGQYMQPTKRHLKVCSMEQMVGTTVVVALKSAYVTGC